MHEREHELWSVFEQWAVNNRVGLEHKDDWGPWWECFLSGVEAEHKRILDAL